MLLIAAAALLVVPAGAIDLTGTWVGETKCTVYDDANNKTSYKGQILLITQVGTVLNVVYDGDEMAGIAIDDVNRPDEKGAAALIDCATTTDLNGYTEIFMLKARVNRSRGKGSLTGTSVKAYQGNKVGTCKLRYQLTNTADPGVAATCP